MTWIGRVISGYRIEAEIGSGGMATVYRAFQPQLERRVALKVLTGSEAGNEAFLARFRREARRIAALRHPNILTIYDYGEFEGRAYIVMEYIAGGTLKELLTGQAMAWSDASTFVLPVARALAYAHSRNIIHCDVKPANILLPRSDWPLLADFGLSRLRDAPDVGEPPGLLTGTPDYVSPEQLTGKILSARSDIYSLGIMLYQLVTGRLPFGGGASGGTVTQRLIEEPTPPSVYKPDINPELESIVLKTLERDTEKRHPDMVSLVRALSVLPGTGALRTARPPTTQSRSRTNALTSHPRVRGPHLIVTGTEAVLPLPTLRDMVLGRAVPQATKEPEIDLGPHGGAEAGVSRHHAKLHSTAQGWFLEDLNSTNGTSLNMAPVQPGEQHYLHSGDVIRCGRLMLVFYEE